MRYTQSKGKGKALMTRALGRMIGLLLSLYVFDEVINAVLPNLYTCPTGQTVNASQLADAIVYCYNATPLQQNAADGGSFATATTFVTNLFPVIGILGSFEIIYSALRSAKLV